jgi:hypothetical protein
MHQLGRRAEVADSQRDRICAPNGLPGLGFWAIVLATLFLVVGWLGKVVIIGIVFLVDPSWFANGAAQVHWPQPTFRKFVAVALLALLASRPHAHAHKERRRRDKG